MATLVKKHHKYYIRVRLPGGREKTISTQTGNRREAERRMRLVQDKEILYKARLISETELEDLDLQEATDRFIQDRKSNGRRLTTIASYQLALDNLIDANSPAMQVRSLTRKHIKKVIEKLRTKQLGDATLNIRIRSLNAFTSWLSAEGYVTEPLKLPQIKVDEHSPRFLTPEELDKFYNQVKHPKWYSTFKVFEGLGLRVSELAYTRREGDYVIVPAEQAKSRRDRLIPLDPEFAEHYDIAMREPFKPQSITHAFRRYADAANISSEKTLHSMRHTYALRQLVKTNNIVFVKELLGHQDVKTTMIYTKFPAKYLVDLLTPKSEKEGTVPVAQA